MNDKDNITRRTRTRTLTECAYCAKFTSGWLLIWHSGKLTVVRSLILSVCHTHTHTHTQMNETGMSNVCSGMG